MKLLFFILSLFLSLNGFSQNNRSRVITTIPSLTEMMFFLDAGDKVVGVTPYCQFPAAARGLPKIGSSFSLDYESILKLKPSVVLLAPMKDSRAEKSLKKLNIKYEKLSYQRYKDIEESLYRLNSILKLGKEKKIEAHFKSLVDRKSKQPKKVLIVIGETFRDKNLLSVRIASSRTFFSDLISKLGHSNAYLDTDIEYPVLNLEMLLKLEFDLILRVGSSAPKNMDLQKKWKDSLFKNKVKFLFEDYTVVPGPRVYNFYHDLKGILN